MMPEAESAIELLGPEDPDVLAPVLVPPDPAWPEQAGEIVRRLRVVLGPAAVRVDHVGSTAVPGIWSKPTLDIQVSVPDVSDEAAYASAIAAAGWPLRLREPGHRLFRAWPPAPRLVHVHVCTAGSVWERDHLLFRDYLQAHDQVALAYEAMKRELAVRPGLLRTQYTEAKTSFISSTLGDAKRWADKTGWSVGTHAS
jgi:GrpB-like predicted nucleotidyltransferase (UPF0157 family)